jgi:tetratricopeptide (TPR) repeat protein
MSKGQSKNMVETKPWSRTVFEIEDQRSVEDYLDEEYVQSILHKAKHFIEQKDYRAAETYLQKGLARVPKHPQCLAYMAICLAESKRRFLAAEEIATEALRQQPGDPRGHYALGRINLVGSRRRKAFQYFNQARSIAPEDTELNADLQKLDPRRTPPLPFLSRNHFLNVYLGKTRAVLTRGKLLPLTVTLLAVVAVSFVFWLQR